MESYEVEIKGRTYPVKSIRNLTGMEDALRCCCFVVDVVVV
jgi:hypothetical protein